MIYNFAKLICAEFERVCAEGVRIYDITAAVIVAFVDFFNHLGVRNVPMLGQLARLQTAFLQESSHAAVEVNYIIFNKITNIH